PTGSARYRAAGVFECFWRCGCDLDDAVLRDCDAVFDRAAMIALPPPLREHYVDELYALLPAGCSGLLITLEYLQHETEGPPFSVAEDEVRTLFSPGWSVELLERRDILTEDERSGPGGRTSLHTSVYRLVRR